MQCLAELSPGTGVNPELVGQLTVLPEPRLQSAGHLEFRYPAPKNFRNGQGGSTPQEGQRGSKRVGNGSRRGQTLKKGQKPSKEGQRG